MATLGIQVIRAASRQSAERQVDEVVPLQDGEQVLLVAPIRLLRPYAPGPLVVLRKVIETSSRGMLRLTDRRLVLLKVRASGPNEIYIIPRENIGGVEPAAGGYLRLRCDDPALPAGMAGIQAGMSALEAGIAGGLMGGGGLAGAVAGGAVVGGSQGRRNQRLAEILTRELGR